MDTLLTPVAARAQVHVNSRTLLQVTLASPARDEVIYQDDYGYDQQDMDQAATEVSDESQ